MLISIVLAVSLAFQPGYEVFNSRANAEFRAGHFEQAEELYRRALDAAEKERARVDPAVAMILGNLAGTEHARGQQADAEALAKRAIAMLEKTVGPGSVLLVPALNTLGGVYFDTGRYDEAEAVLKRAMRLGSREAGPHYATTLHNLAAVNHLRGHHDRAAKLYAQALRIRLAYFGPEDPLSRATARSISTLDQASTRLALAAKSKPENSPR